MTWQDRARVLRLFTTLTEAEILATETNDGVDVPGPWVSVPDSMVGMHYTGSAVGSRKRIMVELRKQGYPVNNETGMAITFTIEGALHRHGQAEQLGTVSYAAFSGDSAQVEVDAMPWMRCRVTAYTTNDGGASAADKGYFGQTVEFSYVPSSWTEESEQADSRLYLPRQDPPKVIRGAAGDNPLTKIGTGKRPTGDLYPVLITLTNAPSGNVYFSNVSLGANFLYQNPLEPANGNADDHIGHWALNRGWAFIGLNTIGRSDTHANNPGLLRTHWRSNVVTNLSGAVPANGTTHGYTPQIDLKWAIQWVRMNAERYRLDPDRIFVVGQNDGGALALISAYGHPDRADGDQTLKQLQMSSLPNLVGAIRPDVDWEMMEGTLRCPLQSGTTDGTQAITISNVDFTTYPGTIVDGHGDLLSPGRFLCSKFQSDAQLRQKGRIPFYISVDNSAKNASTGPQGAAKEESVALTETTSTYAKPSLAAGVLTDQLSCWHGYYMRAAAAELSTQLGDATLPIVRNSVLNIEAGTPSTANGSLETDAVAAGAAQYLHMLEWAEDLFGLQMQKAIASEAVFDVHALY